MDRTGERSWLSWSAAAIDDLESILERLDEYSVAGSMEFEEALHLSLEPLRRFPKLGRKPLDFDLRRAGLAALRELLVGDYRVGYVAARRRVEIIYVAHARRLFPPIK